MSISDDNTPAGHKTTEAGGHAGGNGSLPVVVPPGQVQPPPLSSTPNAPALLRALRRRWLLAATLGVLAGAAIGAAVWFFLPPGKHTAYAKLYMPARREKIIFDVDNNPDFATFQRTQLALLRGR